MTTLILIHMVRPVHIAGLYHGETNTDLKINCISWQILTSEVVGSEYASNFV